MFGSHDDTRVRLPEDYIIGPNHIPVLGPDGVVFLVSGSKPIRPAV